jgi:enterochelin esterase-like enzyme
MKRLVAAAVALTALVIATPAHAQAPTVVSPEVTHTGTAPTGYTVTFRIYDPTATRMRLRGEWFFSSAADTTTTTSAGRLPSQWKVGDFPIANPNAGAAANWPVADMTLDPATGIWSYTTPMPSGTYTYNFYRNCTAAAPQLSGCAGTSDPANPPWNTRGSVETSSQVYVPSDPAFGTLDFSWQAPLAPAATGKLDDVSYPSALSTTPVGTHDLAVYTPPGYDPTRATAYPLLIISHGAGGNEIDWSTQGVAGRIIDNLIASGKMQPAVVAMTNFNGISGGVPGYSTDVLGSVVPYLQSHYNVSKKVSDMAFGGLSAGGQRANDLLLNHTTSFGYFASWSPAGSVPAAGDAAWNNPDLKKLLGLQVGVGLQDGCCSPNTYNEQARLTAAGVPFVQDNINGGHEWYVWRQLLRDFAGTVAFRQTSTGVDVSGTSVTATVTPGTTEPVAPTGTVQFSAGGTPLGAPVPLTGGKATLTVGSTAGASAITATYNGDAFYNASSGSAAYEATGASGTVGGSVGATLSLSLGAAAAFGPFTPGVAKDYNASTTATVISTAGDATLTVSDPSTTATGHLVNGAFSLPSPLTSGGSALPATVKTWSAPVSNDAVPVAFAQHIGANDALRTGAYSKTLTFTLSTTTP